MIRAISNALHSWRDDPMVHAVVIEGAGGRAFCAGGDIRWIRDRIVLGEYAAVEAFFVEEYALNLAIARYSKPFIALIDGVCMGGGIGLSVHGSIRVVTEAAMLAMPEVSIGFFPDVGTSFILPRLRPGFGMFMGLTGARMNGADAVYIGLATHYVTRERLASLANDISESGLSALTLGAIPSPHSMLLNITDAIIDCFDVASVDEIMKRLAALDSDWARDALTALRDVSPSSVLWSFELLRRGANQTLEQCLKTELTLACYASRYPDFQEGVRAMLVDKDRMPHWAPARLEDVDVGAIANLFF